MICARKTSRGLLKPLPPPPRTGLRMSETQLTDWQALWIRNPFALHGHQNRLVALADAPGAFCTSMMPLNAEDDEGWRNKETILVLGRVSFRCKNDLTTVQTHATRCRSPHVPVSSTRCSPKTGLTLNSTCIDNVARTAQEL